MWRHQKIPSLLVAVCMYILNLYTLSARREYPLCIMAHCSRERRPGESISNNPIDSPYTASSTPLTNLFIFYMDARIVALSSPRAILFCILCMWAHYLKGCSAALGRPVMLYHWSFNLNNNAALCKRTKYFSNVSTHTRAAHRRVTLQMNYCGRLLEHWILNIIYFTLLS